MSTWTFGFYHRMKNGKISEWRSPEDVPQSGIAVNLTILDINGRRRIRTGWYGKGSWHIHAGKKGDRIVAWTPAPIPFKG